MTDIKALLESLDRIAEDSVNYNIGDPVIITGEVRFKGKTGDVVSFGQDKKFVVVDLYNYGRHSFHTSDVSYNDYVEDDEDEEYSSLYDSYKKEFETLLAEATRNPKLQRLIDRETEIFDLINQIYAVGGQVPRNDPLMIELDQIKRAKAKLKKQPVKEYGPQGTAGSTGLSTTSTQINTSTNKNTPEQDKAEQEALAKIKKNPGNPLNRDLQTLLQKAKNIPQ